MELKPGDILYRRYSYKNDLYCVIAITKGISIGTYKVSLTQQTNFIRMLPYYHNQPQGQGPIGETEISIENWYIKVDLNDYKIKDKFLKKIKTFLVDNLGKAITYDVILDNLIYIEILAELKKYQKDDIVKDEE